MEAIERPWRCSIRSSKSVNLQPSCSAMMRPTLVLPAPMNPTRTTADGEPIAVPPAQTCRALGRFCIGTRCVFTPELPGVNLFFGAFLEMDFTTEGAQHDRRCGLANRTCEGTPLLDREPGMGPGLKRNIVVNFAFD